MQKNSYVLLSFQTVPLSSKIIHSNYCLSSSPYTPLYTMTGHQDKVMCIDWTRPKVWTILPSFHHHFSGTQAISLLFPSFAPSLAVFQDFHPAMFLSFPTVLLISISAPKGSSSYCGGTLFASNPLSYVLSPWYSATHAQIW